MTGHLLQRLTGIGAVSFLNVALTALQSILLGRILEVADFGITRTATAYMVTLAMLGHFTLHNAVASRIGRTAIGDGDIPAYIVSAACLVGGISTAVALTAIGFIVYSGLWSDTIATPLAIVIATLPLVCLSITFNACLEALGSFRRYALVIALTAAVPLLLTVPLSMLWSLPGWLAGRVLSAALLAAISVIVVRRYWRGGLPAWSRCVNLLTFARIQIVSGLLSLVMMSADVILLERITRDLALVANYGVALLFISACAVIPTVLGRIYFREIAASPPGETGRRNEFLRITLLLGVVCGVLLYYLAPPLIAFYFGTQYATAGALIRIMALGLTANFLWSALSCINVAEGRPQRAAAISLTGALTGAAALFALIPIHGAAGAAWAMIIANASGCAFGLIRILAARPCTEARAL